MIVSNEKIFNELRKGTSYGCRLLSNKFYESSRKTISAYFGIQYFDTGEIVNDALEKVIKKISSYNFTSEEEFTNLIKKIVSNTAKDYLRKKQRGKKLLKKEEIEFISLSDDSMDHNIVSSENKEIIVDGEEYAIDEDLKFDELMDNDETAKNLNINNLIAEFEFFCDTETISHDQKKDFLEELLNSFTLDDRSYLMLYLNGIKHKEIAKIKKSNEDATRQYINRLIKKLLKLASEKLNKNFNELYENFKNQNKKTNKE